MDKKLQKEILKMFIDKILIKEEDIINNINQIFFSRNESIPNSGKIKQQIDLLIDDNALIKKYEGSPTYFRMTEWGELKAKGGIKKLWYWLIKKNHNLIAFVAVIISIIAIIISIYKNN